MVITENGTLRCVPLGDIDIPPDAEVYLSEDVRMPSEVYGTVVRGQLEMSDDRRGTFNGKIIDWSDGTQWRRYTQVRTRRLFLHFKPRECFGGSMKHV